MACALVGALAALCLGAGAPSDLQRPWAGGGSIEAVDDVRADDAATSSVGKKAWHEAGAELAIHLRSLLRGAPEQPRPAAELRQYRVREAVALVIAEIGVRQRAVLERHTADRPSVATMPVCGPPSRA